jgi:Tfp pilus assembly protein PilF
MVQQTLAAKSKVISFGIAAVLFLLTVIPILSPYARAESLASKNKRGNRLFAEDKYEDAEKAYLSAQADDPGRPEVLYNLGNSLIKQNKLQEGVQALGQSIQKGGKGIKEKGWFNTGNALFASGKYKDSADAYIESLKLDPGDREAKYNLELALMKLKQQEQEKSRQNQQRDSKDQSKDKPSNSKQAQPKQSNQDKTGQGHPKEQNQEHRPQADKPEERSESMSRDRAIQLLDAMKNQELEEQRKLLERRARERANGKDW